MLFARSVAGQTGAALCISLTDTSPHREGKCSVWAEGGATLGVPPAGGLGCLWDQGNKIGNLPQRLVEGGKSFQAEGALES